MKEEKILIGQSDGLILQLSIAEKLRRINNSTMPTLIALGLSGNVETVIDDIECLMQFFGFYSF